MKPELKLEEGNWEKAPVDRVDMQTFISLLCFDHCESIALALASRNLDDKPVHRFQRDRSLENALAVELALSQLGTRLTLEARELQASRSIDAATVGRTDKSKSTRQTTIDAAELSPFERALGYLASGERNVKRIARLVGLSRQALYKNPRFKLALEIARDGDRGSITRGYVTKGRLEAEAG